MSKFSDNRLEDIPCGDQLLENYAKAKLAVSYFNKLSLKDYLLSFIPFTPAFELRYEVVKEIRQFSNTISVVNHCIKSREKMQPEIKRRSETGNIQKHYPNPANLYNETLRNRGRLYSKRQSHKGEEILQRFQQTLPPLP